MKHAPMPVVVSLVALGLAQVVAAVAAETAAAMVAAPEDSDMVVLA